MEKKRKKTWLKKTLPSECWNGINSSRFSYKSNDKIQCNAVEIKLNGNSNLFVGMETQIRTPYKCKFLKFPMSVRCRIRI